MDIYRRSQYDRYVTQSMEAVNLLLFRGGSLRLSTGGSCCHLGANFLTERASLRRGSDEGGGNVGERRGLEEEGWGHASGAGARSEDGHRHWCRRATEGGGGARK